MPTLAYSNYQQTIVGGTLTSTSFTPQTGDIIVYKVVTGNQAEVASTPTGGGWVYTSRVSDSTASKCWVGIWTAPVTAGGTPQTVVGTFSGGNFHSMVVELWRTAQLAATPATCKTLGSGAPSTTITTVANNSVVSWLDGDWSAIVGSPTYRTSATQEGTFPGDASSYATYFAWQSAASAGVQTIGLTAPAGQSYSLLGIEVQDSGAAPGGILPQQSKHRMPTYFTRIAGRRGSAVYSR